MTAKVLQILDKHRPNPSAWVRFSDFKTAVSSDISARVVLEKENVSLYCVDLASEQFIFVESDPTVDLSQAPFFFQAQFEHAQRLVTVPFAELHNLVDPITVEDEQLILLYSVGRCGSTLLSDVFNQLDEVASLSEPDVFTELLKMRKAGPQNEAQIKRLLKSSVVALMKPLMDKRPLKTAIKFRSFGIELIDLISELFPHANNLFMYRNAEDWARSTAKAFQKLESEKGSVGSDLERRWAQRSVKLAKMSQTIFGQSAPVPMQKMINRLDSKAGVLSHRSLTLRATFFPAIRPFMNDLLQGNFSRIEYISLEWVSGMCRFLQSQQTPIPLLPFRYEELVADPKAILTQIFDYCGLPETAVSSTLSVFENDSQRGTHLARTAVQHHSNNQLTEQHLAQIHAIIQKFPELGTPDVVLPGTIGLGKFPKKS